MSLRGYNGQCFDTPRFVRMILHSKLVLGYVKIKVVEHIARTTCKCAGFECLSSLELVDLGIVNDIEFSQMRQELNSVEFLLPINSLRQICYHLLVAVSSNKEHRAESYLSTYFTTDVCVITLL